MFKSGDETQVGERGITLRCACLIPASYSTGVDKICSGGQKVCRATPDADPATYSAYRPV